MEWEDFNESNDVQENMIIDRVSKIIFTYLTILFNI